MLSEGFERADPIRSVCWLVWKESGLHTIEAEAEEQPEKNGAFPPKKSRLAPRSRSIEQPANLHPGLALHPDGCKLVSTPPSQWCRRGSPSRSLLGLLGW